MPSNLAPATVSPSSTVLPNSLSTSFVEANSYPILTIDYHDGTRESGLIVDGVNPARSLRMWTLAKRLTTSQLTALRTFWEVTVEGGLVPFYFYQTFQEYDPTGSSTTGRVTVFFRGNWAEQTQIGRHIVPNLVLVEVA